MFCSGFSKKLDTMELNFEMGYEQLQILLKEGSRNEFI